MQILAVLLVQDVPWNRHQLSIEKLRSVCGTSVVIVIDTAGAQKEATWRARVELAKQSAGTAIAILLRMPQHHRVQCQNARAVGDPSLMAPEFRNAVAIDNSRLQTCETRIGLDLPEFH